MTNSPNNDVDALIIGGGPAGLTAALYLGRARKSVVVVDRGAPRHGVSEGVHNFLTREGMSPAALRETAWAQMAPYDSVRQVEGAVTSLSYEGDRWQATRDGEEPLSARTVLLATGVIDLHPDIPGYQPRWGHSIHHCPYCHGWEMRDRPLAVLASGEAAAHLAPLLLGWSADVVVLTHGETLDTKSRELLDDSGIRIYQSKVVALEGPGSSLASIHLADGTRLDREGLFVSGGQRQVPVVDALGLDMTDDGYVQVDPFGATSRPMLWAAGDLTSRMQQVVMAAAQGAGAGAAMNAALTLR